MIPGTPDESVVSTITLAPRHGGAQAQSFTFTGPFKGFPAFTDAYSLPSTAAWKPDLDPTLEYCVSVSSFGFGDSRAPAREQRVRVRAGRAGRGAGRG